MAAQPQTASAPTTPAGTPTKGTVTTPQGTITWEKSADGTVIAVGSNGQKFTSSGHVESDGSWAQQANYAITGQTSYLSLGFTGTVATGTVQSLISAGASRLTLTVSNINAAGTSGTATLSGTWNGTVVKWTGPLDLTANPFVSHPIAGWPAGAFATELQSAAFFAPLGNVLAQPVVAPATVAPHNLAPSPPPPPSPSDVVTEAGAACLGAMLGSLPAGPETFGISLALACAGGVIAVALPKLLTWVNQDPDPEPDPNNPPVLDPPDDPDPTDPGTGTDPDDPPPSSSGGSGDGDGDGDGEGDGDGDGDGDGGGDGGGGGGGHGIDKPPTEED